MKFIKKFLAPKILSEKIFNYFFKKGNLKSFYFKIILRLFIFILFGILFFRPQGDLISSSDKQNSYNIIFAIDNSISSLAKDGMKKNRLERSKDFIGKTIKNLGNGNFALVEFSGNSFISIPFTNDLNSFYSILSFIGIDKNISGTNFGSSLKNINSLFSYKKIDKKILVLFTDGENQNKFSDFEYLNKNGISIISVGIGSEKGSKIPLFFKNGEVIFKKYKGKDVLTKLDKDFLKKLSSKTGGKYFDENNFSGFISFLKKESPKTISNLEKIEREEYFQIIAFLIFILLIIELFFDKKYLKFIAFFTIIFSFSSCTSTNWKKGIEEYNNGNFEKSSIYFEKSSKKEDEILFNFGTSSYKEGNFEKAYEQFQKIKDRKIINSGNLDYQIGNTSFKIGEKQKYFDEIMENWKESVAYFEIGLEKKPKDKKMKENLEFVKKKIKDLKEQNSQKTKSEKKGKKGKKKGSGGENKLEKKDLEGLKKDLEKLKKQEKKLNGNFERFGNENFKLEGEPSVLNMKSIEDILGNSADGTYKNFQTGEKDW